MSIHDDADVSLKVIAVGDAAVGKTSIVGRYVTGAFEASYKATIGTDVFRKIVTVEGRKIGLLCYDTAGQERFRSMTPMYYRGAAAAILVYDITSVESFENVKDWVNELRTQVHQDVLGDRLLPVERAARRETHHHEARGNHSEHHGDAPQYASCEILERHAT